MNTDELVAKALNSCRNEGLDMLGGADRAALEELLCEFIAGPASEAQPPDCKHYPLMNNVNKSCALGNEDFDSHFQGFQEDSKLKRTMPIAS